ncbi:MAG: hypothetical protein ACPKQO_08415 [Nitrososphaeraceae archaeon]
MRMLQHRGKAYWKILSGKISIEYDGSIPNDKLLISLFKRKKITNNICVGYLSKRSPIYPSMNSISVVFDGFFVDTEKLSLHPLIGSAKDQDSLYQIYHIFNKLIKKKEFHKAAEFLDRHLRGNIIFLSEKEILVFRNSTGFKPLSIACNDNICLISSENSLRISFPNLSFKDVEMGQLFKLSTKNGIEILSHLKNNLMLLDPFEFIKDSHVTSLFNGKSIYSIRKNIGKLQANFLSADIIVDSVYAEPDYTRPMALGICLEFQKYFPKFEISEGIIKDRYDDSDHMTDFSEQVSKNKLLTTGRSLKFMINNLSKNKKVATLQGTLQTGSTVKETISYLKNIGAKKINVLVSYVPTIDGRQVGLYTYGREFIANKYVGKVYNINQLNTNISKEIGSNTVFYNSPSVLSKGIGISESNLWFPEWIRFLDYE